MKITNDKITFDAEDFNGVSEFTKKALEIYLPNYVEFFADQANAQISIAQSALKSTAALDPVTDSILAGLASADEAKLKEAEPLLAQLDELLTPKTK